QLDKQLQEEKNKLRDSFLKEKEQLQAEHENASHALREKKGSLELSLNDAKHQERQLREKVYFASDVKLLTENLAEITKKKPELVSQLAIKNSAIESLKKESNHMAERNKLTTDQFAKENQAAIASCEEEVKKIDEKLASHKAAFFGFLQ